MNRDGEGVRVGVGVHVGVGVAVGVGVSVGVYVAVGVAVGVSVGTGVWVGAAVGVGAAGSSGFEQAASDSATMTMRRRKRGKESIRSEREKRTLADLAGRAHGWYAATTRCDASPT